MTSEKLGRMRYCFNCGEALGVYKDHDPLDHCGKQECQKEAQYAEQERRREAHEKLDRDMGWEF